MTQIVNIWKETESEDEKNSDSTTARHTESNPQVQVVRKKFNSESEELLNEYFDEYNEYLKFDSKLKKVLNPHREKLKVLNISFPTIDEINEHNSKLFNNSNHEIDINVSLSSSSSHSSTVCQLKKPYYWTRGPCPNCSKPQVYFCRDCFRWINIPRHVRFIPCIALPVYIDIIIRDKRSKATGLYAKMVAPDYIRVIDYPDELPPDYKEEETLIVFPSHQAFTFGEILRYDQNNHEMKNEEANHLPKETIKGKVDEEEREEVPTKETTIDQSSAPIPAPGTGKLSLQNIKRLIVIDSKWNNCGAIVSHPYLQKLNHVKIETLPNESKFWRWQSKGDGCLSTIEALYYILKEYEEAMNSLHSTHTQNRLSSSTNQSLVEGNREENIKEEDDTKNEEVDLVQHFSSLKVHQDSQNSNTPRSNINTVASNDSNGNTNKDCFSEEEIPYERTRSLVELLYLFRLNYFMIKDDYQVNPLYQNLLLPMDARKKAMEVDRLVAEGNFKNKRGLALIQPSIGK